MFIRSLICYNTAKGVIIVKTQWTLISALIFALITAIFAVINVAPVQVNYLFGSAQIPLILVILSSTLLGGLIVGLFGIIRQYKLQRRIRQLEAELKKQTEATPISNSSTAEQSHDSTTHETEGSPSSETNT
jgi:lipopolysaccharide assembly protein A